MQISSTLMPVKYLAIIFGCLVIASPVLHAESTDCGAPVIVIPDGRISLSTFPQSTLYWYGVYALAGHPYTVEFESASNNSLSATVAVFSAITVYGPSDSLVGCRGTSSVTVTPNDGYSPVIKKSPNGNGRRASFTGQSAGLYLIAVSNVGSTGPYSFRATDTTLVNPRWSTYGGYFTYWGLLNLSDMTVNGVFTVYDPSGRALDSVGLTLAPGTEQFHTSLPNDMNIGPNLAGYATFSHNGPIDAVIGDSYMVNSSGAIIYVSRLARPGGN